MPPHTLPGVATHTHTSRHKTEVEEQRRTASAVQLCPSGTEADTQTVLIERPSLSHSAEGTHAKRRHRPTHNTQSFTGYMVLLK